MDHPEDKRITEIEQILSSVYSLRAELSELRRRQKRRRQAAEYERQIREMHEQEARMNAEAAAARAPLRAARAKARWAFCTNDTTPEVNGDGRPRGEHRLDPDEIAIARDPSKSIQEAAQELGMYVLHVREIRERPAPSPARRPGRPSLLSDENVRALRRCLPENLEVAAARLGISPSYAKNIRYRAARADVPDLPLPQPVK